MFQPITYVHLCILGMFAALGLKGLLVVRDTKVSMQAVIDGRPIGRVTYSDVVLLFAVLSFMSLDHTSVEFAEWGREQLKHGLQLSSLLPITVYLTALGCALAYAFGGAVVILGSGAVGLMRLARNGAKN